MAWTAEQQAAIDRTNNAVNGNYNAEDEENPWGWSDEQRAAIERAGGTSNWTPEGFRDPNAERSGARAVGDFTTGVVGAIPKALGGIVSLGSYVPGVNLIADPVAEALMDAGSWVDETFLSDYQQNINADFAQAIANSARQLGEDATISDHLKNIANQGGAAANFLYENPSQAAMVAGQAIPYIFGGGVIVRGLKGAEALAGGARVANLGRGTQAAIGEGLMAAGAAEEQIVSGLRDQGVEDYTIDRLAGIPAGVGTALIGLAGGRLAGRTDIDTIITNRVSGETRDLMADLPGISGGLVTRTTKGAAIEGGEELLQGAQEQAFTNLGTGDSISQDVGSSAVTGMFAGGLLGGGMAAISGRGGADPSGPTDARTEPNAVETAADEIVLQNELAANEATAAAAQAEQQAAAQEQEAVLIGGLRDQYAPEFTTEKDFNAARDTRRIEEVRNPDTEAGQAFRQWRIANERYGDQSDKAVKDFLGDYLDRAADKGEARSEYLTALDQYAAGRADGTIAAPAPTQQAATTDANATTDATGAQPVDAQGTPAAGTTAAGATTQAQPVKLSKKEAALNMAVEKLGDNWQEQYPELSALAGEGKNFYSRGKNKGSKFESMLNSIEQENAATQANLDAQSAAQPAAQEAAPAVPEADTQARQLMIEEANKRLGPNWNETNPELVDAVASNKLSVFSAQLNEAVDAKKQAEQEAAQDTESSAVAVIKESSDQLAESLRGNQKSVFTTLMNAIMNNESDKYIQAGGQINFKDLAADAGLNSRQAAQAAMKQLRPKIAQVLEVTEGDVAQALRATSVKNVEAAPGVNDTTSVLDVSELTEDGGMGTLASVGQNVNEGLSEEDIAFKDQRSNEPDPVYEARVQEARNNLDNQIANVLETVDATTAVSLWEAIKSDGAVNPAGLNKQDTYEWLMSVMEFEQTGDRKLLEQDQREIERRYDANEGGVTQESIDATNTESNEAAVAQSEANAQETSTVPEGSPSSGGAVETSGTENTGQSNVEAVADERVEVLPPNEDGTPLTTTQEFIERAAKVKVESKKNRKITRMGVPAQNEERASRETFEEMVNNLTGGKTNTRIHIFENEAEAVDAVEKGTVPQADVDAIIQVQPYGWVTEDENGVSHAHFILDRIASGNEKAAFMHEVGSHIGIDNLLTQDEQRGTAKQILDWADKNDGSVESDIARRAIGRVDLADARGGISDGVFLSEIIAYTLEEATLAGIEPSNKTPLGQFLETIINAMKSALAKINLVDQTKLTPQDLVDLAYGAAQIDLMTEPEVEANGKTYATKYGVKRDWVKKTMGSTATQAVDDFKLIAANAVDSLKFLHQFIRENTEKLPSAKVWMDRVLEMQRTRQEIIRSVEGIALRARDLKPERLTKVNEFLSMSTFYQKWGYQPAFKQNVKVDPVMAARYKQLTQDEQQIVQDIFAHGDAMLKRRQAIAKALGVNNSNFFSTSGVDGPYAPLKRFGNYVAELKSQRLLNAEAALAAKNNKINQDAVEKLKSDPDHYVISFFDTLGSAKKFRDANASKYAEAVASPKEQGQDEGRAPDYQVLSKVLAGLGATNLDKADQAVVRDMVEGLYYKSLDESSARLAGLKRKNRAGFEKDMVKSFLAHAQAESNLISQMEHGAAVNEALVKVREESRKDRENLTPVYNQIARHYRDTISQDEGILGALQDQLTAVNSAYMLTTNVAYHVTNATQPIMVTIPKVAADTGGYASTWRSYFKGIGLARKIVSVSGFGKLDPKIEVNVGKAPAKYQKLLEDLQLRQLLDVGMEEDLSNFRRMDTGYKMLNDLTGGGKEIMHRLYQVARMVESYNRVSAAVTAFDMAERNAAKIKRIYNMTPQEYATAVVEDTQGNFSRLDAPLLIKSLPKTMTQYRKYQIMMGWLYANAAKQAFAGDTKEVQAAGKRTLAYATAHAGIAAGAVGIPGAGLIAPFLFMFLGEGDEPDDLERYLRDQFGDEAGALIARGVGGYIGADFGAKLSQGNIFTPFPYMNEDANLNERVGAMVLGPVGATANNFFRASQFIEQGDYWKAIELSVPKGVRSAMESWRLATEGNTLKNGDVIQAPTDFDAFTLIANSLGFGPSEVRDVRWRRGQIYQLDKYFSDTSSRLQREYVDAQRDRDTAEMARIRDEWAELQRAKDRVRPFYNDRRALPRQGLSVLGRAGRNQSRREQQNQRRLNP